MSYTPSAALMAYIRRIGAEELSFKRYMVKEYQPGGGRHYYEEKAVIWIDDGKIKCNNEEYAPTNEEREAIELGLINADIPKSIGATSIADLRPLLTEGGKIYEVWDRKTDTICMVQHAIVKNSGDKYYVPWSLWSDNQWRKMEPDGKLKFYKPRRRTNAARLMIHEGAKSAQHAQKIVDERIEHPWFEELYLYEHWGMLGGAMAPHRSDYAEISDFVEVVYACDNDKMGHAALQKVSISYGKSLKGLRPDDKFEESWDMADPMPQKLYVDGRWVGPSVKQLLVPATWATAKIKKATVVRKEFKEEWVHCVVPEVFVHRDWPNRIYDVAQFNNRVSPFSHVSDTATFLKKDDSGKVNALKYNPAEKPGIYSTRESGRYVNTHVPCSIRKENIDVGPWIEFVEHLFPNETDRWQMMRWCATLIARPDIKMSYGALLISETQGVGKGTLGEKILAPLVGEDNVSFPSENEIVDSNYNYWLAHKRLAVVHEIYAGHSAKAYNRLKSVITDRHLTVSKKYLANYDVENWVHVFACSNSMRAIQLSSDDRRWFVPKVVEEKRPFKYWIYFNSWLTDHGGLSGIRWWANDLVERNQDAIVTAGEDAPWSSTKKEVINEGMPPSLQKIVEIVAYVMSILHGDDDHSKAKRDEWRTKKYLNGENEILMLDQDFRKFIRDCFFQGREDDRIPKLHTIRKICRHQGCFVSDKQIGVFSPWSGGRKDQLNARMIGTAKHLVDKEPAEIFEGGMVPMDLEKEFGQI